MAKVEKFIPKDTDQNPKKDDQAVVPSEYDDKSTSHGFGQPAKKRKYSEQPPVKRNAKT